MPDYLIGNSVNPVDDKSRASLPTKFRKPLSGSDLVIVRSQDREYPCLNLFALEDYYDWVDAWFASDDGYKLHDTEHQRRRIKMMNAAESIKLDASYRIRFTQKMLDYAQIGKRVKFLGMGTYIIVMAEEIADKLNDLED